MSMYRSYDLIVDGNRDQVSRAFDELTTDGWLSFQHVQGERVITSSDEPLTWWTFDAREQCHDSIVEWCARAAAKSGAHLSLEWYASHRSECGGHVWSTEFPEPREWRGVYYGVRGG